MPKISVDTLKGISPLPKKVTFDIERDDKEEKLEFYIYPFTTDEKVKLKQMALTTDKMDHDSEDYITTIEEQSYLTIHMILKKSVDGITLEDVKTLPQSWYEKFVSTALSFEGIKEEQIAEIKKKQQIPLTK